MHSTLLVFTGWFIASQMNLRLLAKAKTRDQVASGPEVEGTTGREAKDLIRELRAALVAAGFTKAEAETLIATARGRGYRLGVPASGIQIDG